MGWDEMLANAISLAFRAGLDGRCDTRRWTLGKRNHLCYLRSTKGMSEGAARGNNRTRATQSSERAKIL